MRDGSANKFSAPDPLSGPEFEGKPLFRNRLSCKPLRFKITRKWLGMNILGRRREKIREIYTS